MATLHLVNQAASLDSAVAVAAAADTIVLLEDGVYALSAVPGLAPACNIVAVQPDLDIRGLVGPSNVPVIDYDELVELCTQHQPITTWC